MAESFGSDADRYDRARPSYPDALVDRIIAASPGRDVLDVGCGTGIAARLFQAAGCRVLGVDADARMADLARRRGLDVEVAKFEDWDPAGRTFDAVVAGQAWHWVDPVAGAAQAARALRPGGRLAVFWNAFQPPAELAETFASVYRRVTSDAPLFRMPAPGANAYSALCAKAADGMGQASAFSEIRAVAVEWIVLIPARSSWISCLPPASPTSSRRGRWMSWWRASARPSTRSAAASPWATPR